MKQDDNVGVKVVFDKQVTVWSLGGVDGLQRNLES